MAELALEKWQGTVHAVTIGATKQEGGTRGCAIVVGGEGSLPCLKQEGPLPYEPVIAYEIWDMPPQDWHDELLCVWGDVVRDPVAWAQACVKKYHAKLLCVRLQGSHPDSGNTGAETQASFIRALLKTVDVPLIVTGSGDDTTDNAVLPACSEAAKGERILIGTAVQDNYKTLTAAAIADGHNIIAESPIDINIAKQLNILISDMGLALERIVINPTIGALGYGLEYAYSIMERSRLAALAGDKTVASPFIAFVAQETWRSKEAKVGSADQGIVWEALTAVTLLQAGADILVMRHPRAIEKVDRYIKEVICS
jgi:acetyl-CoA decarbonylase/synthase complex subunit delta